MYCRRCDIHFPDNPLGPRCPACGETGTGSVALKDPPPGGGPPPAPPPEAITRTERPQRNPWAPGARVAGKYEVVAMLGSGGFGTVYKVRHLFRKKYYALKTPHPQFVRDEVFRKRFEREIEAMERFVHPDAVTVRDSGLTEFGIPYYTMDFIEGESLKAVLSREGRLTPRRASQIVRRVLRVLEAAHEGRIIHRDLKPDNILLRRGERDRPMVLDFGVAKLLDLVDWSSITRDARVGTPRYMSPEQITGGPLDGRSDLFSLGIIFYELVTGRHPFSEERDHLRLSAAILNVTPAPPRELEPALPRALSERILWMLERKPKKRPQSAREALLSWPEPDRQESGILIGTAPLSLSPGVPRAPLDTLVLRRPGPGGERRSFLFFKDRVRFGRAGEARGEANDLILRCLPCRSEAEDPENWRRNRTLSQGLGALRVDGGALWVEPCPGPSRALELNGVKCLRAVRIGSDRFHLSLGERALDLDCHLRLRRREAPHLDLGFLASGRPPSAPAAAIGYARPDCEIDHVHLQRANNHPLHDYFLVARQLVIGSGGEAGLRLDEREVEAEHALILFHHGEAFITPLGGEVRVVRTLDAPPGGPVRRQDQAVERGAFHPLASGIEVILGGARLIAEAPDPSWFKTT